MRGPCELEREDCPYKYSGCFSDTHHTKYPASEYTSPLEKTYRNLPENKVQLCRDEHDELHATEQPPVKPTAREMLGAIATSRAHISSTKRKALGMT